MIRSSSHSLKFSNAHKLLELKEFITEYRSVMQIIIEVLWLDPLSQTGKFLSNEFVQQFSDETWLNQRALQCCAKQALAMVKAAVRKRQKQIFMLKKLQRENKSYRKLQSKISKQPLVKPIVRSVPIILDSRFVHVLKVAGHFNYFLELRGFGKNIKIRLPLKATKVSNKWLRLGKLQGSVRINETNINLIFKSQDTPKNEEGQVLGADQGLVTALTLSDGQSVGNQLKSICDKVSRRKPGFKGFHRAQKHRVNYINQSLNQLDCSNIKELRVERLHQIRRGKRSSATLTHWTYTEINRKLYYLSEEEGFQFTEVPNAYRSQRCSQCGWVCKANRKRKVFSCNMCGNTLDADLNAALNLELELAEITFAIRSQQLNRRGFYWLEDAIIVDGTNIISDEPIVVSDQPVGVVDTHSNTIVGRTRKTDLVDKLPKRDKILLER